MQRSEMIARAAIEHARAYLTAREWQQLGEDNEASPESMRDLGFDDGRRVHPKRPRNPV